MVKRCLICVVICTAGVICGCDPIVSHKITSTIFDGVPSLPPAEQYCQEYHERKKAEELDASKIKQTSEIKENGSIHPPYEEKNCDGCHDKTKENGLIRPKQELCFVCHPDIVKGEFAHGPAAVGGCLECHEPHSSNFPSLLKTDKAKVCVTCHSEARLAEKMHQNIMSKGVGCVDCHDPHAGPVKYFLR
jgi:predicted CXXCH cytochrome family protein